MKIKYKYIEFIIQEKLKNRKTDKYTCRNHVTDEEIGEAYWNTGWRQYCFYTRSDIQFSGSCLIDIADFLKQINIIHKSGVKNENIKI